VTSIADHGLGTLATLSSVGSREISDASITDADIAGTAAIATSKLSCAHCRQRSATFSRRVSTTTPASRLTIDDTTIELTWTEKVVLDEDFSVTVEQTLEARAVTTSFQRKNAGNRGDLGESPPPRRL
jgi:hypothetical protein